MLTVKEAKEAGDKLRNQAKDLLSLADALADELLDAVLRVGALEDIADGLQDELGEVTR